MCVTRPLSINTRVNFVLAHANADIENLQEEILSKTDDNVQQHEELRRLSYEMREVHSRLNELKKENDELKVLLSMTGKHRHEYETKVTVDLRTSRQCIGCLSI